MCSRHRSKFTMLGCKYCNTAETTGRKMNECLMLKRWCHYNEHFRPRRLLTSRFYLVTNSLYWHQCYKQLLPKHPRTNHLNVWRVNTNCNMSVEWAMLRCYASGWEPHTVIMFNTIALKVSRHVEWCHHNVAVFGVWIDPLSSLMLCDLYLQLLVAATS